MWLQMEPRPCKHSLSVGLAMVWTRDPARSILRQVYILRVIGFLLETQQHFMIFICSQFSQMIGSVYLLPLLHYQTVLDMHNLGQMKRKNISFAYWVVY